MGTSVPGGAGLSTYQELCSLATDLGQPDLVYKFMDLAHHQQALNTRRGAAFGFANVAKLAGDALAPHVAQLVPKLYRCGGVGQAIAVTRGAVALGARGCMSVCVV